MLYAMHGDVSLIAGQRHSNRFVPLCPWACKRRTRRTGLPAGSAVLLPKSVALPTIVADAYYNADARRPEADAGTRTVIPVTIGTALDVSFARCVIVRVPDDHAAAAASAIASSVITTDHTHGLHERQIRTCVFAARIDVSCVCCAAGKQGARARQYRHYYFPHGFLRPLLPLS